MNKFDSLVCFGFSPTMLFPKSFEDELIHFHAIQAACRYPHYESFETMLPDDKAMRETCIREMKANEKILHYNTPGILQQDGPYNPCSDDPESRERARAFVKKHVDYAGEAESPLLVLTGCPDKGEARRAELLDRYMEFFLQICEYSRQYGIQILIEPIERHRFKKLILGPTKECADFILKAQSLGADNAHLMLDTAHLPLMEENIDDAITASLPAGLLHVHMGDAVLEPDSVFYGHTHPPVGVQGGQFDLDVQTEHFKKLFECGYIPRTPGQKRATISLEVRPYPGASEETSIQLMYEKMKTAFNTAAASLNIC